MPSLDFACVSKKIGYVLLFKVSFYILRVIYFSLGVIMRKLILPIAFIATAALVGCGDDNSSNPAPAKKSETLPEVIKSYFDTDNYVCSEAVNKCKTMRIEGLTELVQCNGSSWVMQMLEKPVDGCDSATPTENPPAGNTSTENPPVDNPPVDNPPASGNMVSCDIPGVMGECLEVPAGSAEATAMEAQCVSVMQGTLGTGCPK